MSTFFVAKFLEIWKWASKRFRCFRKNCWITGNVPSKLVMSGQHVLKNEWNSGETYKMKHEINCKNAKNDRRNFVDLLNSERNLRSPYSPYQSRVPCAPSFLYFPKPRCIAAVCWFLLRGCVFRSVDACQKRFSWVSDWIPKVQKCA